MKDLLREKVEEGLPPVCYRGRGDDPRERREDEPRSEARANYSHGTIGSVRGGSLKSLGKSITVRWPRG